MFFKILTVAAINLLIILGASELLCRYFGYQPLRFNEEVPMADSSWGKKDPLIGWTNNPGVHRSVESGNAEMTFWSMGQRATRKLEHDNLDLARPTVLIIGDSWSQGYGVGDSESFGWKLQQDLPSHDFQNFGTGGHGVLQSWLMLQRYYRDNLQVKPKIVIFAFTTFMNDRNTPSIARISSLRTLSNDTYFPPFAYKSKQTAEKYTASLPYASSAWPLESRSALLNFLHECWLKFVIWLKDDSPNLIDVSLYYVQEMQKIAVKNEALFLFVWLNKGGLYESVSPLLTDNGIMNKDCEHPKGFIPELRVGGDGHPNGEYHTYIADCIKSNLETLLH